MQILENHPSYHIYSLGDSALTIDFGNRINEDLNAYVMALFVQWSAHPLPGAIELVPAYSSLTLYYDLLFAKKNGGSQTGFDWMKQQLEDRLQEDPAPVDLIQKMVRIPVCYDPDFAPDLPGIAAAHKISMEEVIHKHLAVTYKVYMLGFIPGFAYMGTVDADITMPRKPQPVRVVAGSIGIAGTQTGIYPIESPGGWHIIGRTPVSIFDAAAENPVGLQVGYQVQFYRISREEFETYPEKS